MALREGTCFEAGFRALRKSCFLLTLAGAVAGSWTATAAETFAPDGAARPPYVKRLEEAFGPPSRNGFGSTVLFATATDRADLERLARLAYRHFTGDLWEKWGEAAWMGPWRLVFERRAKGDILAELHGLDDPQIRSSADMVLDATADPSFGRDALTAAFDDPAVHDLLVFAIGDGGAMSGLLVAARRDRNEATFLVFLMD